MIPLEAAEGPMLLVGLFLRSGKCLPEVQPYPRLSSTQERAQAQPSAHSWKGELGFPDWWAVLKGELRFKGKKEQGDKG